LGDAQRVLGRGSYFCDMRFRADENLQRQFATGNIGYLAQKSAGVPQAPA
jgi:hypothetical protein